MSTELKNENETIATTLPIVKAKTKDLQKKKDAKKSFKKEVAEKNLSKFADRMNKFTVSESSARGQRSVIYKYPESWTSRIINGVEGKTFRRTSRNEMSRIFDKIYLKEKAGQTKERNEAIKEFLTLYKKNFTVNDLTVNSFSQVTDAETKDYYSLIADIIKDSKIKL